MLINYAINFIIILLTYFMISRKYLYFLSLTFIFIIVPLIVFNFGYFVFIDHLENHYSQEVHDKILRLLLFNQLAFILTSFLILKKESLSELKLPNLRNLPIVPIISVVFFTYILSIIIIGPQDLLRRGQYETGETISIKSLRALIEIVTSLAPMLLGFCYSRAKGLLKFICIITIALGLFYYVGLTTRFLAICPFLFLIGRVLAGREIRTIHIIFAVAAFPLLLYIPINSRAMIEKGILPVFYWILDGAPSMFIEKDEGVWQHILENVFHGYILTIQVIEHAKELDFEYFIVSVNPLPGSLIGWYDLAPDLRLNIYVPYNLYGQLFSHGVIISLCFFIVLSFIIVYFDRIIRNSRFPVFIKILIFIFGLMFLVLSFQYSLRSAVRFLDYGLVLAITYQMLRFVSRRV